MRVVVGTALLAVGLGLAARPAAAQNTYQQVVMSQLGRFETTLREQGYNRVMNPITGSLAGGSSQANVVFLNGGMRYAIVGACDQDCRDFDLRIFGPDGPMIDEDVELDDTPVLEFTAPASGQYRLMAMMANCQQNPCYWGIVVTAR